MINRRKITVTMSMEEYKHYECADLRLNELVGILKEANKDGTAVMTDRLRNKIEEIYL